ncbi:uncharacterized protein LOC119733689 [Patiria miniata]|uniref:Reverse transcriptase n=1 Tax=Patiria miniata TaxID=46514 RepID=A0A914AHJ9_PATMI|nr:uncharacterized protein LOC119733689 [Patiria miniata]
MDIFEILSETGSTYESGKDALTKYFEPRKNIEYERFVFREAKQLHNETVADYATRLQQLARNCEFHDKDTEVKSQIIHGCKSSKLRRHALRESELILVKLLTTARTYDLSEVQANGMEQHTQPSRDSTNRVTTTKSHTRNRESIKGPHALNPDTLYPVGTAERLRAHSKTAVAYETSHVNSTFFVTKTTKDTLISFIHVIIHVAYNLQPDDPPKLADKLMNQYADRFTGIGMLKNIQCKLHEDKTVQLIALPHCRIPYHVRKKVENELEKLLCLDIIAQVRNEPTSWVPPIHVVEKPHRPGEIRMCVDMRNVNTAIKRERHITPTIDVILAQVNGSTVFSKFDVNAGYHQVELAPESRHLTVFSTHKGLFCYKRLNFGVCSAAEVFQDAISSALRGLAGTLNISDDILVFGRTQQERDARLAACLQRLRECNPTLNKDKCRFGKSRVEYSGHVFSSTGISPDKKKVDAIQNVSEPTNASEVRSFLGMITNFIVITDHKPLVPLFNNPHSNAPTRIERWLLKLQEYNFTVEYQQEKLNPADYMSRHPHEQPRTTSRKQRLAEEHVNFISANAVPEFVTFDTIRTATRKDPVFQSAIDALTTHSWDTLLKNPHSQQTLATL